ncbi:MAG: alpha/beta fold hydrolase [candidate division WOR-3 bacterium]
MKNHYYLIGIIVAVLVIANISFPATCPIIFIHGQRGGKDGDAKPEKCWPDWNGKDHGKPYHSAMDRILVEHYRGYGPGYLTNGDSIDCDMNSSLTPTGGETRKIYNFSYYHPDGSAGVISLSEESVRVYVSHGYTLPGGDYVLTIFTTPPSWGYDYSGYWPRYIPWVNYGWVTDPNGNGQYWCLYISLAGYNTVLSSYINSWKNGKYAKRLAEFINKVLTATGASKVDIVAHSMGGLVARAAIKYYGSAGKVRKLLMIGTPNHPYQHSFGEWIYDMFTHDKHWQKYGEDFEMDVDMATGEHGINFETSDPTSDAPWCDHLGYENVGVQMATIAGNRGHGWPITIENDKVAAVSQVKMGSSAQFEPTIYASHSYDGEPEVALTTCTYTEEFIKNWMIDDNTTHVGGVPFGTFQVYDTIPFDDAWDTYELRLREPVDNYYKTLTALVECWTYLGSFANKIHLGYRAFPLYRYSRGCPGDPIFATNPAEYPSSSIFPLYFYTRVYDMNGLVSEGTDALWLRPTNPPEKCNVEIVKPVANEVYTVQSTLDKLDIKFEADFYKAQILTVWFSWGGKYALFTSLVRHQFRWWRSEDG